MLWGPTPGSSHGRGPRLARSLPSPSAAQALPGPRPLPPRTQPAGERIVFAAAGAAVACGCGVSPRHFRRKSRSSRSCAAWSTLWRCPAVIQSCWSHVCQCLPSTPPRAVFSHLAAVQRFRNRSLLIEVRLVFGSLRRRASAIARSRHCRPRPPRPNLAGRRGLKE